MAASQAGTGSPPTASRPADRQILTAEMASVGSELTVGETRDTNAGDVARSLTGLGVRVLRVHALPDELETLGDALATALGRADLIVTTGGLGPTPDDLTREAIAGVAGEEPVVDPGLEEWLRDLWARRGMPFPELNLKQAWLIPSATAIPNPNGTAPGWWVDRPDGRVVVALPGPPHEMEPMWREWVLPRLLDRGIGREVEIRTLRLTGIGESQVAERLGNELLSAPNPIVATYARADAVDVRIAARPEASPSVAHETPAGGTDRRTAVEVADAAEAFVLARLGEHVWARGETRWPDAIGACLGQLGWGLATVELGTGAAVAALLGETPGLRRAEAWTNDGPTGPHGRGEDQPLDDLADAARSGAGCEVGLAVRVITRGADTAVSAAVVSPRGRHRERRVAFLGGAQGRSRAALAAAAILLAELRRAAASATPGATRAAPTAAPPDPLEVPR